MKTNGLPENSSGSVSREQYGTCQNLDYRIALHRRFSTADVSFDQWVFRMLKLPEICRILEVGCGNGSFWSENSSQIPKRWNIHLSDRSSAMVATARENMGTDSSVSFTIADVLALPYRSQEFEVVVAKHMLYHIHDRNLALSEVCRVLTQNGVFYATTNGNNHMRELIQLVREFDPQIEWYGHNFRVFGLENGEEQLTAYFRRVSVIRFRDALRVNDADAIANYVLSTGRSKHILRGEKLCSFRKFLQNTISAKGAIHISKDSGLFVAEEPL